jgi:hypothetical protein
MNNRILGSILAATIACGPVLAQEWAYLGGSPQGEIDVSSITKDGRTTYLRVRIFTDQPQGRMFMNQVLGVDCVGRRARISDGWITSSFSPRVAPMPDLPEDQRWLYFPVPNEAYNNMFAYVCGSGG